MMQRGYDQGIAARTRMNVARTLGKIERSLAEARSGREELAEAGHLLAEETGYLLALAEPQPPPKMTRAEIRLASLQFLVGRARALDAEIDAVAIEAKEMGASWLQIAKPLGITKEDAYLRYGARCR